MKTSEELAVGEFFIENAWGLSHHYPLQQKIADNMSRNMNSGNTGEMLLHQPVTEIVINEKFFTIS